MYLISSLLSRLHIFIGIVPHFFLSSVNIFKHICTWFVFSCLEFTFQTELYLISCLLYQFPIFTHMWFNFSFCFGPGLRYTPPTLWTINRRAFKTNNTGRSRNEAWVWTQPTNWFSIPFQEPVSFPPTVFLVVILYSFVVSRNSPHNPFISFCLFYFLFIFLSCFS